MQEQEIFIGSCSVCDRKEVEVRFFEVSAFTGEGIHICLECQPVRKPPGKGGRAPEHPHLNPGAVSIALADAGFRGPIKDTCLSMLTRWSRDHGLLWVVEQVRDDTGLTRVVTADTAHGAPRFFFTLWETRDQQVACETCEAREDLLYLSRDHGDQLLAYCDRCYLAGSLKDIECFRCEQRSDGLTFCPIDGSEFGIYLCPTCHVAAGRSPEDSHFWADAEVISVYTDDMAVDDGVLIDLEALGVKAEHGGLLVNRMTSHLFHQLRNMAVGMHNTLEEPLLVAELEATLKTKMIFAHDSDGDGVIITLPSGSETDPIWLVRNEVGGYTAMFASDY